MTPRKLRRRILRCRRYLTAYAADRAASGIRPRRFLRALGNPKGPVYHALAQAHPESLDRAVTHAITRAGKRFDRAGRQAA